VPSRWLGMAEVLALPRTRIVGGAPAKGRSLRSLQTTNQTTLSNHISTHALDAQTRMRPENEIVALATESPSALENTAIRDVGG
jgi:hypothetical protein